MLARKSTSPFTREAARRLLRLVLAIISAAVVVAGIGTAPANADTVVGSVAVGLSPAKLAVNPLTNKIYVPNSKSQTVSVIDGATNKATVLVTRPSPEAAVVNTKTNKIYIGHRDGYVTIIDGPTNSLTTVETGGFSAALVVNESTNLVYVANGREIVVINGTNNAMSTIPVDIQAAVLAINPSNNKLYISSWLDQFAVLDLTTMRLRAVDLQLATTETAWIRDIGVNRATNKVYVVHAPENHATPGSVSIIDGLADTATTIRVTSDPRHLEINDKTNRIYVAHQAPGAAMTEIDGATNATKSYALGVDPLHTAINTSTNKIYVAESNGAVGVFSTDTKSTGIVRNDSWGYARAIAVNAATNRVYVANIERVDVVDGRDVAPSFTSGPPPAKGQVGSYYGHQFAAKGSLTPKFKISAGSLPAGLTLNEAGLLSGVPSAAGTFYFKVAASNGTQPDAVTATFGLTIKPQDVRHDFTGDGKPDVLARDAGGGLWLYPGNGSGGWLSRKQVGQGWNVMTSIVAPGDFNGDGRADLLARGSDGILWMYPGNGNGGWLSRVKVGQDWNSIRDIIAIGDFTLDGNPDLLGTSEWSGMLIYPGNGKGGWFPIDSEGSYWPAGLSFTAPGDFNKDGFQDVIFKDAAGNLILDPGYEDSMFQFWNSATIGWGWNAMTAIVGPGDFNGDGNVDLLARDAGGALWLYPGNGKQGWLPRVQAGSGWNVMNAII